VKVAVSWGHETETVKPRRPGGLGIVESDASADRKLQWAAQAWFPHRAGHIRCAVQQQGHEVCESRSLEPVNIRLRAEGKLRRRNLLPIVCVVIVSFFETGKLPVD